VNNQISLARAGWQPYFQQQVGLDEWEDSVPARIVEQHRSSIDIMDENGVRSIPVTASMPVVVVGDWILLNSDGQFSRLLERQTCFRRRSAGAKQTEQLLAANVDTAFILCSVNDDFNLNRIERYLSVVNDASAEPVVVLSKIDLCHEPESYKEQVQALDSALCIEMINALDPASTAVLHPWCTPGRTIVMLGSSGVGKSTLTNSLAKKNVQSTSEIREDDSKGRHTTTSRSLIAMDSGAMLLDTPGMRELQMADFESGITATFSDIDQLARQCRFTDCSHSNEPGCAVQTAITENELDPRRFDNYLKLLREQQVYASSIAERRATDKALGRFYKRTIDEAVKMKRGK
jgi:ribosome biogenesis GTPase